ncbi:hypothetical protein FACS1894187_21230 [Synergistales bacterium]|nr:hypothetical protein FACS1894187_21230 [Synergistales bacterium]
MDVKELICWVCGFRRFFAVKRLVILLVILVGVVSVALFMFDGNGASLAAETGNAPSLVSKEYFLKLGDFGFWLIEDKAKQTARGAVIHNLREDFRPLAGWVLHTERVRGGNVGDTIAKKGEDISLYIPATSGDFSIK